MIKNFISKIFCKQSQPEHIAFDVQDSKKRLKRLSELTARLDSLEDDAFNKFEVLRMVADSLDIAIWGKDLAGRFVFLNRSCAERILHTTVDEAIKSTDDSFDGAALASTCAYSDSVVIDTLTTHRFVEHAVYPNGAMWLDCTKSPWIRDDVLIGTVGSAKDITAFVPQKYIDDLRDSYAIEIDIDVVLCVEELDNILKDARLCVGSSL